jgi:hypothetical protein
MRTFWEFLVFELRYQFKQPVFYIGTALFFLMTFGAVTSDTISIGGGIGSLNRNAPYVIMQILTVMSVIGVFTSTAIVANSTYRDIEHNMQSVFFSTPITKGSYLFGRFWGACIASILIFTGVVFAFIIGSLMPWLEPDRIGPFSAAPYAYSMFMLVVPNLLVTGALFFSLAAITRSMLYTYAGLVGFFVAYAVSQVLLQDIQNETIASLLDPFGISALTIATRYWTVFEKNTMVGPTTGVLLYNRLIWLSLAAIVLFLTYKRFRFTATSGKAKKKKLDVELPEDTQPAVRTVAVVQDFSLGASVRQYLRQTQLEFTGILKSLPFLVILALGVFNCIGGASVTEELYGTPVYPVTHLMLNLVDGNFLVFAFLILTLYSGELTWKERSLNLAGVMDAMPVRDWVPWASKLSALILVLITLLIAAMLTTMSIQMYYGYTNFQLGLYLKGLFLVVGLPFILIGVLAYFFQTIINNKFIGFLLMVVFFISRFAFNGLHWEHVLYQYAAIPDSAYSDMNGYGHFVKPIFWVTLYWAFGALILTALIHLFRMRGSESSFRLRMRIAKQRLKFGSKLALATGILGMLLTGAYIFYNTNVLNQYVTTDKLEDLRAEYEKKYEKYENIAMPRITSVFANVDIDPENRSVKIRGSYHLENKTQEPIKTIHVSLNKDVQIEKLELAGGKLESSDKTHGYHIYRLTTPLKTGEKLKLDYVLIIENRGFPNSRSNTKLVYNGTFFNSNDYFPHLGYFRDFQLVDPSKRKKYGLPPVERLPKIDDENARRDNALSRESDWMDFETVVSTSPDQIAIAPGYLQKEWTENGRRYFHYKMDSPILAFWSYLSARYAVKRDRWNDVAIEIYYDPAHPYNVDRMIAASKKSLDYFTTNFGPYQHKQVRIIEFPRYERFAQSFPNTIPFSESIGFIARISKPEDIDYVTYVTAHEIAHQWWAHQVIGANQQGSTMLVESMSQYSALMVMEKEFGSDQMKKFLKYELNRYLSGRGAELVEEQPLMLVEDQPYIHYAKGSLTLYALRDWIGEKNLNQALSLYIKDKKFQQPPYTNSREMISYIARAVPSEKTGILKDLFETITLYDLKTTDVQSKRRSDGKYDVSFNVEAHKFRADGKGKETETTMNDWIDVGVLGAKQKNGAEKVIALEKKQIHSGQMKFEFVVNEPPEKAGIDPLNKMIDRNPDDNTKPAS